MRWLVGAALVASAPARADEPSQEFNAADAAESGNFLPYSESPSTSATYITTDAGYDTARGGAIVTGEFQIRLQRRIYFIASGEYEGPSDHTLEPSLALQVIVTEEKDHGVDVAVFGGWDHAGFNTTDDGFGRIAVAGHVHGAYVLGGAALALADGTLPGELTLGGIRETLAHLYAGVDSRGRMDLEHTDVWTVQAGPVVTFVAGMFSVTAVADVSVLPGKTGARTMLGVGAVF